ncbi:MAG: tRNA1(Val) (adenine(37)-N6)-methyltransferase [Clostridiales bacterium]|nr:tRNA1(Val) (adenine(37)-N6)-methyltransferase [Clostridiales bacterium]MDD7121115.1 tRNA1(Val) (adenine(37)-N6)-methyltransferase [Clostridiales bacterium]MDY5469493.1 tRNA1(Val) (adenine(37)-N6)-methyltransferase [Eubacteriales bacterium]
MMYLNERIDDLQRGGLRVIQRADAFRFGTDAVLLADFAAPRRHDRVCDLGTGTGIIPLLLYARENTISADAVEIQPDMADMAARSMAMNGLNEKIRVLPGDLRSIRTLLPHARYDLVTCNPPYGKAGGTLLNPDASKRLARHEESCAIEDVACAAAWLLQNGGRLCCVFPAARMIELSDAMRKYRMAPKRIRMVHSRVEKAAHLCLMEGMLDARPGLIIEPPLVIYDENNAYTPELRRIYGL